ncbi:MAG: hypothetical protein HKN87_03940 [Saprospiraceae bacterium]|nr:hypothetical protein [Saprospiraceae bacterium]
MDKKVTKKHQRFSRRDFISVASAASLAGVTTHRVSAKGISPEEEAPFNFDDIAPEWRNQQSGMSYRMLGRTGMMISEIVSGGDPVVSDNTRPTEVAIEKGLNYLDMAPAYNKGDTEVAYGKILAKSGKRDQVFLTTKVSGFGGVRSSMYRDIFDGLPSEKQNAIIKKAQQLRDERGVDKPGYYFTYWPGQERSMTPSYIANAMVADYGHKVDGSKAYQDKITSSVEGSLARVGTDYFDILMCPHGANCPEEVQIPEIWETYDKLKRDGKVRYLGLSTHNDPAGVLRVAAESNRFDVCMCAYNVINGGYLEETIRFAHRQKGMGIIAMKAAMAVATHHKKLQPTPQWRIDKVNRIVPGELKAPMKAYLWALQNKDISAVISNLWDLTFVEENLSIAGQQVTFNAG